MDKKINIYQKIDSFKNYKNFSSNLILGKKKERTFFSIIIPTYKRADTLQKSLQSALFQEDFNDYEIIIINNDPEGDNNETRNVIEKYMTDKIIYYVNEKNLGMCGNWNRAIELASGEYIIMLHDDDILSPYHLKTIYSIIRKSKFYGIIGVGYQKYAGTDYPVFFDCNKPFVESISKRDFFWGKSINITGMTFNKKLALELGGFADKYYPNADTIFIYQTILKAKVLNIHHILAGYRIENNASLSGDTLQNIILMTEKIRESIAEHETFAKFIMKKFDTEYLWLYIKGASQYWSHQIESEKLFELAKLKRKKVGIMRLNILRFIIKVKMIFIKIKNNLRRGKS